MNNDKHIVEKEDSQIIYDKDEVFYDIVEDFNL